MPREVVSRGKHLLTRIGTDLTLHTHVRMDGSWHLHRPGSRWTGGPDWQVRAVLRTDAWVAVGYRLPVLDLLPTADEPGVVGHLGPDLLGPDWDTGAALRRLRTDPGREIGQALLDQRNLAGIGNLYKTETCFLRGVSPWTPVAEVLDLPALVELAHRLLDRNETTVEQVTTGDRRTPASPTGARAASPGRLPRHDRSARCSARARQAGPGIAPDQPVPDGSAVRGGSARSRAAPGRDGVSAHPASQPRSGAAASAVTYVASRGCPS